MRNKRIAITLVAVLLFSMISFRPVTAEAGIKDVWNGFVNFKDNFYNAKELVTDYKEQKRVVKKAESGKKLTDSELRDHYMYIDARGGEKVNEIMKAPMVEPVANIATSKAAEITANVIGGAAKAIDNTVKKLNYTPLKPLASPIPKGFGSNASNVKASKPKAAQNLFTNDVLSNFKQMSEATAKTFGGNAGTKDKPEITLKPTLDKDKAFENFKAGLNVDGDNEVINKAFENFEDLLGK